jgi:hypothetical protein
MPYAWLLHLLWSLSGEWPRTVAGTQDVQQAEEEQQKEEGWRCSRRTLIDGKSPRWLNGRKREQPRRLVNG